MGLPDINIAFKTIGITAIGRSQKGVVALIVRDGKEIGEHIIYNATQIPKELGVENKKYMERTFLGYVTPPKKVIAVVIGADAEITTALNYLETQQFDYLAAPPEVTAEECTTIKTWITSQRMNAKAICKAVLPNMAGDHDAIINFTSTGMTDGTKTYTPGEYCSRIAGLIAGTPMTISCTYAPLPELTNVTRLTREEADKAIDAGKFILVHDGEKVKVGRGVNSLVSTNENKGEAFQKIKMVEAVDMMGFDIRRTAEDNYIGKYANSYDNKCLLIMAIKGYFEQLELNSILDNGKSSVSIDLEQQEVYLTSTGTDTSNMSEQQIKEANTGSKVFLSASVKPLDAIEDIDLAIVI